MPMNFDASRLCCSRCGKPIATEEHAVAVLAGPNRAMVFSGIAYHDGCVDADTRVDRDLTGAGMRP